MVFARYTVASILCSCGGLLLGMDTSMIGPVTLMESFTSEFGQYSPAVHGIVVSCILLSAAFSSFFAGWLADVLGRTRALAFGAGVFTLGAALQAAAFRSLAMFTSGRIVQGLGYGLFFGTQTVYICEISPPQKRGPLTTGPQFATCVALVLGYFISHGTVNIPGSLSWRLPYAILAATGLVYTMTCLFLLTESPRWFILRHRNSEAEKAWDSLGVRSEDREIMTVGLRELTPTSNATFKELFSQDFRKRTTIAVFLMGFLQLCGIDAVLYYAPLLFRQAGLQTQEASFLASGISAIVIVVTSIPATLFADKWGRRTSTLVGGVGLTATMILIGSLYDGRAVHSTTGAGRWVVIVCIYLFCVTQATTWAISIKVWAPEIQPDRTRAQAISLAHGFNWTCNFFVAFICPILLDKSTPSAYFLFGGCTAVATVVSFVWMVETRGKSLIEIESEFSREPGRNL